jgi:hypothetical protein
MFSLLYLAFQLSTIGNFSLILIVHLILDSIYSCFSFVKSIVSVASFCGAFFHSLYLITVLLLLSRFFFFFNRVAKTTPLGHWGGSATTRPPVWWWPSHPHGLGGGQPPLWPTQNAPGSSSSSSSSFLNFFLIFFLIF